MNARSLSVVASLPVHFVRGAVKGIVRGMAFGLYFGVLCGTIIGLNEGLMATSAADADLDVEEYNVDWSAQPAEPQFARDTWLPDSLRATGSEPPADWVQVIVEFVVDVALATADSVATFTFQHQALIGHPLVSGWLKLVLTVAILLPLVYVVIWQWRMFR